MNVPKSISRQFGSGLAWMALGNWAEQAINFLVFVILARLLGAESFGLMAMAAAFVILAEFLVRESLSEFLISHPDPGVRHYNAAFWLLCGLGAVLWGALALAAGPIARFYGHAEVAGLMQAMAPTVLMIAVTAVPVARLRRQLAFRSLALRAIAGVAAGGLVGVGLALSGYGLMSLVAQRLTQVAVNVALAWFAVGWRPGFDTGRAEAGAVLRFGGQVLGLRAAELSAAQAPSVLIGASLGPAALGLWALAWRLIEVSSFLIVTPLRMAAQPAFASMNRAGERAADLLADIDRLAGLIALPMFAGLALLAGPVLQVTFGVKWLPAAPVLQVLCLMGVYLSLAKVQIAFCLAAGQAGRITLLAWLEVGVAALSVHLAAPFGLGWAAAAYAGSFLLLWPLRLAHLARLTGVGLGAFVRPHLAPALASLAMAALVLGLFSALPDLGAPAQLALGTGAGIVAFATLALIFMRDRLALAARYGLFGKAKRKQVP